MSENLFRLTNYLSKQSFCKPQIKTKAEEDTAIIIVIPAFDEKNIIESVKSIYNCNKPKCKTEVIIVFNSAENTIKSKKEQNEIGLKNINKFAEKVNSKHFSIHGINQTNLPKKHAGVGLARKIGMDEALARYNYIGKEKGLIVNFDADALCSKNYLIEIHKFFTENPNLNACSIYFEHPVSGDEYSQKTYKSIIEYELYLRYYNQAMRYTKHPHAFHTIGSSFAVRADAYARQGGMNKRKAGEDFYFLQKIIPQGNYGELNSCCVKPSPRPSDRVPFGTGATISKLLITDDTYLTYNPKAFYALKKLFSETEKIYNNDFDINCLEKYLTAYLKTQNFDNKIKEIKNNSASLHTFKYRFFSWLNAFRILKYLNFAHEKHLKKIPIFEAANQLFEKKIGTNNIDKEIDLLSAYRKEERSKGNYILSKKEMY